MKILIILLLSAATAHAALTAAHGATGAVMGTTNTQTVTNKTMGSGCAWGGTAVPVANGGTGKTTAAEALAALGGASLNGSSTVDFVAQKLTTTDNIVTPAIVGYVHPIGHLSGKVGNYLTNLATKTVDLVMPMYSAYEFIISSLNGGGEGQPTYVAYGIRTGGGFLLTEALTPNHFAITMDGDYKPVIQNTSGDTQGLYYVLNMRRLR